MNIEGLGEALVDQLLERRLVGKIPDLYSLKYEDLTELERMGPKSSQNVLDEIERTKQMNLDRLIFALGIRHVGERTAQDLAAHFKHMDALAKASVEELTQVEDVGPTVAESVHFFFKQPENRELINTLRKAGLNLTFKGAGRTEEAPLAGLTFVLTGTLESLTRDQAKEHVESLGGTVASSVSSKTDYVVVGDSPGSKLKKAQKLSLKMISEKEFLEMIRES